MFQEGNDDCPGEVVYSLQDRLRANPENLQPIAARLFSLKGTKPTDPALAGIANYLTDEKMRVFGLAVPAEVSPALRCQISTTFFFRKHLPMRRLCAPQLPIVVNPKRPYVALPLPQKYWPQHLVDWWSQ